jgi:glycosyltransferase involved in cell wall biosynthesis
MTFDFVGPLFSDGYSQAIRTRAVQMPNVVVHGQIAKGRVGEFYRRAAFLCCTSDYEGFPNTFLEAWSYGLPIVSTFDPDQLIAKHGLGMVGREISDLRNAVVHLTAENGSYRDVSRRVRAYYEANHTLAAVMPRFEHALMAALETNPNAPLEAQLRKSHAL